jgi:hypothetical protein
VRTKHLQDGDEDFDLEEDFYRRHPHTPRRTDPPSIRANHNMVSARMGTWVYGRDQWGSLFIVDNRTAQSCNL